jgi:hypothetical protein
MNERLDSLSLSLSLIHWACLKITGPPAKQRVVSEVQDEVRTPPDQQHCALSLLVRPIGNVTPRPDSLSSLTAVSADMLDAVISSAPDVLPSSSSSSSSLAPS